VRILCTSSQKKKEIKILFLRGNSFKNMIGTTDIEIAFALLDKYDISIVSKKSIPDSEKCANSIIKVIEIPYIKIPYLGSLIFNVLAFTKLNPLNFDIIIVNSGFFITAYLYKKLHQKTKIVLDIRSTPVDSGKLSLFISKKYLQYSLNSGILSGVTIITESMYNYLKEMNLVKLQLPVAFWSSGVNRSLFKPMKNVSTKYFEKPENSIIVSYHGTLSQNRGIHNLIKAINLLIEEGFDNIKLLLAGSGKDETFFKEEVIKLNINSHVIFTGVIPYNDIPKVISNADLAVIPFPKSDWWEYQSPLKIFEYLAMGVPIIATDLQAHRQISDSILLMPNNFPETIRDSIKKFIKLDSFSQKNLKRIAIEDSINYTWEKQANILSQYLEKNIL
jgi:glycosyltransferase involved in cell wall biosynthesis